MKNATSSEMADQNYDFIYLLLTEFEVRTVSYGPSLFPFDLWPKRKAHGPWIVGEKTRIRNLQYGPKKRV